MTGIRGPLEKQKGGTVRPSTNVVPRQESNAPKNGPLVLMVVASILIMAGLVILNLHLIRDPSVAGKAFCPSPSSAQPLTCPVVPISADSHAPDTPHHVPPVVTFYRQLTAQDDQASPEENSKSESNADQDPPVQDKTAVSVPLTEKTAQEARKQDKRITASLSPGVIPVSLPMPPEGSKKYTVQVGAFTHPAIAQQWAEKWKAKGFKVSLKPVARPRTGIIYRLYLGTFSSEKKADELVNRLKSKEGISAFRLLVRN